MSAPVLFETHSHTPLCKHAVGEPEEYARTAIARGLKGIVVTCHNPMPNGWGSSVRMEPSEFDQYVAIVDRARQAMRGQTDVRLGLECDYVPGKEEWLERQVKSAPLEYVLGSVHPHMSSYRAEFFKNDIVAYQRTYFDHLARAAETRLFDTISHPDLVKNIAPTEWIPARIQDSVENCLDRIARTGVAMELNTSGLEKSVREMNPGPAILRQMYTRGIPVVIGADAHTPVRVGADFVLALDALTAAGYSNVSFFLQRTRHEIAIGVARESLLVAASSEEQVR